MSFLLLDAIVTPACITFGLLACTEREHTLVLRTEAVDCIIQAMAMHGDDLALQEITCSALASLSDNAEQCRWIVDKGGVSLVLRSLRRFCLSRKIAYSSLYFLENASEESTGKRNNFPKFFVSVRQSNELLACKVQI